MRGLVLLIMAAALGGCAAPIGRDGLPIGLGQAICESFPGTRCCRPASPPPPPPPYCTRSLGVAECWIDPSHLPNHPTPLADAPPPAPGCA